MELDLSGKRAGEQLRIWRAFKGLSQDELGELLGVTGVWIGLLERGEKTPSLELAIKIEKLTSIAAGTWATASAAEKVPA